MHGNEIDAEVLGEILNDKSGAALSWDTLMRLYRFDLEQLYADVCSGQIARVLPAARALEVHGLLNLEDVAQHRLAGALERFTEAILNDPTITTSGATLAIEVPGGLG